MNQKELKSFLNWVPDGWHNHETAPEDFIHWSNYNHPLLELIYSHRVLVYNHKTEESEPITSWNGKPFEIVCESGEEINECPYFTICKFGDDYIRFDYVYSSWFEESEFDDIHFSLVKPEKKMVEVTEWKPV
jgi:hypothetical protein